MGFLSIRKRWSNTKHFLNEYWWGLSWYSIVMEGFKLGVSSCKKQEVNWLQTGLFGWLVCFSLFFLYSKARSSTRTQEADTCVRKANTCLLTTGGKRYNLTFLKSLGQCFAFQWKGRPELIKVTFLLRTKHLALLWRLKESCSYRFLRDPNLKQHSQTNGSAFEK